MRELLFQVPRGSGRRVMDAALRHDSTNLSLLQAEGPDGPQDVVVAHVPNREVGPLLDELEDVDALRVNFPASGAFALRPPPEEAHDQVVSPKERSPLEVFLAGLQSVGSWRGFLGYAAAAGAVVWAGLFTNTSYLLVAAMLIAPFAGPAMNAAIATARGDTKLLLRSLARYFAALAMTALVAGLLSLAFQQRIASTLMADVTSISSGALLLPLAAGAAGALNLVQSERASLVSGAAVGILVAASLAPPAGIVGMATALQRWDMLWGALFLILLQLAGINLAGAAVFRLYGMRAEGSRYSRGRRSVAIAAASVTALVLVGLLAWQLQGAPDLQRSTLAQRAAADVHEVVEQSGLAHVVEANARFTRAQVPGQNVLLVEVYVERASGTTLPSSEIASRLESLIEDRLQRADYGGTPLAHVVVLDPPPR